MSDNLTSKQRSLCMSRNKGKDTSIELQVRSAIHKRGLRFRKHYKGLPGNPDLVFIKAKVAVFIDGDFWHGYRFPIWKNQLSDFWKNKISTTRDRDRRNHNKIRKMGWSVIRIWEHEIKKNINDCIDYIVSIVKFSP